jgi:cellobiose phosphorylase
LKLDPCIPSDWKGFEINRKFRNAVYKIKVSNPKNVSKGIQKLIINGKEIKGNLIPIAAAGTENIVEAVLG